MTISDNCRRGNLEVDNICKCFGDKNILNGITFHLDPGSRLSILGPSGCGKTTLLNILAGFDLPNSGRILLDGRDITEFPTGKRGIVLVNQENLLFPHMNVYENIAFGLRARRGRMKMKRKAITEKVKELLSSIELEGYEEYRVTELSGGQKQRVSLARALAVEPDVLLLDEAFSALDTELRQRMRKLSLGLQKKYGFTMVLVTHDRQEAFQMGDSVVIFDKGSIVPQIEGQILK